jgi:hypothetical protein
MAAILTLCSSIMFTACSKDDDKTNTTSEEEPTPVENVAEKIIGKWMIADKDGQPIPTDMQTVYTFTSPTQGTVSTAITAVEVLGEQWNSSLPSEVSVDGTKVTLTNYPAENYKTVEEFNITDISDTNFTALHKVTMFDKNYIFAYLESTFSYVKVEQDFADKVIGLWQCTGIQGVETYNDANALLEFHEDGTYKYWRRDELGDWIVVTNRDYQHYFVDGSLLATRWKEASLPAQRELWEIASISGQQMVWKALRLNEDGSTFQQEVTWKKVI